MNNKTACTIIAVLMLLLISFQTSAQNLIATPECVVYDNLHSRYLVSCLYAGRVVAIDTNGNQTVFISGLAYGFGNTIYGNSFYISTGKTIKGFDLSTGTEIMSVYIPSSHQLDGMTTDTSGNLYVADFQYSGSNDQIYKINLSTQEYTIFVEPGHGLAESPQDLAYDKQNNRLIVANYYNNSPIQAVSLSDASVTNIVASSIGNFDGIARDNAGDYYFTSWGTSSVHKYDKDFLNPPVVIVSGINGPSNLCYDEVHNILAIPVFNGDTVLFHQLPPQGINSHGLIVKDFNLCQNYPNPFNPSTIISFDIIKTENVKVSVFNVNGSEVGVIFKGRISSGSYKFKWDGTNYSSGVYLYKLETDNFSETKKMILVK
jgi:sugar lactone lactonase YvrE